MKMNVKLNDQSKSPRLLNVNLNVYNQIKLGKLWNLISRLQANWMRTWMIILDAKVVECEVHCQNKIQNNFEWHANIYNQGGCHLKLKSLVNVISNTKARCMNIKLNLKSRHTTTSQPMQVECEVQRHLYIQRELFFSLNVFSIFKENWMWSWMSIQDSKQLECVSRTLNQDPEEVKYQSKLIEELI